MKRTSSPEDRVDLASKVVLYGSPSGSLSELLQPYILLAELKHQQTHTIGPEHAEAIITIHDVALLDVAQSAFRLQIGMPSSGSSFLTRS